MRIVQTPEIHVVCPKCKVTLGVSYKDVYERHGEYMCTCCNCAEIIKIYSDKLTYNFSSKLKEDKK